MPVSRLESGQGISLRSFLVLLQALQLQLAIRPAVDRTMALNLRRGGRIG